MKETITRKFRRYRGLAEDYGEQKDGEERKTDCWNM